MTKSALLPCRTVLALCSALFVAFILLTPPTAGSRAFAADEPPAFSEKELRKADSALEKELSRAPWYSAKEHSVRYLPQPPEREIPDRPARRMNPPKERGNWVWGLLALLALLLIAALTWFIISWRRYRAELAQENLAALKARERRLETLAEEAREHYEDLRGAADEAAAKGDYRSAIIFLFSWLLVELDKRELILLGKGKTNLEYWRELEGRGRTPDVYRAVMREFERVYFGGQPIAPEEYARSLAEADEFSVLMSERDSELARIAEAKARAQQAADAARWSPPSSGAMLLLLAAVLLTVPGCGRRYWSTFYAWRLSSADNASGSFNGLQYYRDFCEKSTTKEVKRVGSWNILDEDDGDFGTIIYVPSARGAGFLTFDQAPGSETLFEQGNLPFEFSWRSWPGKRAGKLEGAGAIVNSMPPIPFFSDDSDDSDYAEMVNPRLPGGRDEASDEDQNAEGAKRKLADALYSSLCDYADCVPEKDWTKFCLPDVNRVVMAPEPYRFENDSHASQAELAEEWLRKSPGRTLVCVVSEWNYAWDYWRAAKGDLERMNPEEIGKLPRDKSKSKSTAELQKERLQDCDARRARWEEARDTKKKRIVEALEFAQRRAEQLRNFLDNSDANWSDFVDSDDPAAFLDDLAMQKGISANLNDRAVSSVDFGDFWYEKSLSAEKPENVIETDFCWFRAFFVENQIFPPEKKKFDGKYEWLKGIPEEALLREYLRIEPGKGFETLLSLGDSPIICEKKVGESRLLLLNSAAWIENYGFTEPTNRAIAAKLNSLFDRKRGILFASALDKGRAPDNNKVKIGPYSLTKFTPWTVLTWRLVCLAILFAFASFPIFGRAKKLVLERNADFGRHVDAIALLLKKSNAVSWGRDQIDACRSGNRGGAAKRRSNAGENGDESDSGAVPAGAMEDEGTDTGGSGRYDGN